MKCIPCSRKISDLLQKLLLVDKNMPIPPYNLRKIKKQSSIEHMDEDFLFESITCPVAKPKMREDNEQTSISQQNWII
jgi:hypothetical protein